MAEEDKRALIALLELGKKTKTLTIEDADDPKKNIEIKIRKLSFGEEQNIATLTGEMAQRGTPEESCQREYAKQVAVTGTVEPKFDELIINDIPFPVVGKIARAILNFSSGLEKNS